MTEGNTAGEGNGMGLRDMNGTGSANVGPGGVVTSSPLGGRNSHAPGLGLECSGSVKCEANESISALVNALAHLDNRPVPTPEKYNPESGQPFDKFLGEFERYCARSFRADDDPDHSSWGSQLGKFLNGELREAYAALHVIGEPFSELKRKLLEWMESSKEKLGTEAKKRFSGANRKPNEPMRLYAARLEKYFQVAYPNRVANGNKKALREKFTNSVPGRVRDKILNAEACLDGAITWDKILSIASKHDSRDYAGDGNSRAVTSEECMAVRCNRNSNGNRSSRWEEQEVWQVGTPVLSGANVAMLGNTRPPNYSRPGRYQEDPRPKRTCFQCGSDRHFIRDCPDRRSRPGRGIGNGDRGTRAPGGTGNDRPLN